MVGDYCRPPTDPDMHVADHMLVNTGHNKVMYFLTMEHIMKGPPSHLDAYVYQGELKPNKTDLEWKIFHASNTSDTFSNRSIGRRLTLFYYVCIGCYIVCKVTDEVSEVHILSFRKYKMAFCTSLFVGFSI